MEHQDCLGSFFYEQPTSDLAPRVVLKPQPVLTQSE